MSQRHHLGLEGTRRSYDTVRAPELFVLPPAEIHLAVETRYVEFTLT
ncbi:MAG: hypothetical protein SGJ27_11780 [Candidatus Melainabacteria bacterium]|nr:hypothetical protein [Candidatus Melainabacteria bacterium]